MTTTLDALQLANKVKTINQLNEILEEGGFNDVATIWDGRKFHYSLGKTKYDTSLDDLIFCAQLLFTKNANSEKTQLGKVVHFLKKSDEDFKKKSQSCSTLNKIISLLQDGVWDKNAEHKKVFDYLEKQVALLEEVKEREPKEKTFQERIKGNFEAAIIQQSNQSSNPVSWTKIFSSKNSINPPAFHKRIIEGMPYKMASASCRGRRHVMEDREANFVIDLHGQKVSVMGVFDGHGGENAARYISENIQEVLKDNLIKHNPEEITDQGIWDALKSTTQDLDQNFLEEENYRTDGSTALITVIINDALWVANVGDSRAVLHKTDSSVIQLSEDQKPQIKRYKNKIEKEGGCVWEAFGGHRVNGILAVARAIGDRGVKGVVANPKITKYSMNQIPKGARLILACDGLWDTVSTKEAGKFLSLAKKKNLCADHCAELLLKGAYESGSTDNITVMVVDF
ncbi:MAG: hypothetical protein CMO81_00675 [Waddliaceae bacterium]|nr:hypothetical protein [Waddliaceae bacterium]